MDARSTAASALPDDRGVTELLRFERLLVDLSAGFINRSPDEVDAAITDALRRIADTLEVERVTLLRVGMEDELYASHSAAVAGIEPVPRDLVPQYPWGIGEMRANRHVAFSHLDEVPADAVVDRFNWTRIRVASNMSVPITVGGTFIGALAMATFRYHRSWPDALIERARMAATVLGNALEHKRARRELDAAIAFERMMSQSLAELLNIPLGELDPAISATLHRACEVLGADATVLWRRDGDGLRWTHQFTRENVHPPPERAGPEAFPWALREVFSGRPVCTFVAAMPPEAAVDRAALAALEAKAIVVVPLTVGDRIVGALSFASERDPRGWPQSLLPRVQLFGEMLASVLARDRAERAERDARAEAAHAARLGTMGVVAASLAHELTQPLAAIMSNAEMALQLLRGPGRDDDELEATLQDILADDRRAGKLIHQLRRFLRRDELQRARIDVRALLDEVMSLVRGEVVGKGVSLSLDSPSSLPEVTGNHAQVQQVLLNLLLNAFDAVAGNAPGGRRVIVQARAVEGQLKVTVSDNGIGMDATAQGCAFRPFYTTKAKGMGLGLSISRSIAQAHGGALTLQSEAGKGSAFRLSLPVAVDPA